MDRAFSINFCVSYSKVMRCRINIIYIFSSVINNIVHNQSGEFYTVVLYYLLIRF